MISLHETLILRSRFHALFYEKHLICFTLQKFIGRACQSSEISADLTHFRPIFYSYRLQSIHLREKSTDWFFNMSTPENALHKKISFPLRVFSVNVTKSAGDLATFTEKILNGKLHFCAVTLL